MADIPDGWRVLTDTEVLENGDCVLVDGDEDDQWDWEPIPATSVGKTVGDRRHSVDNMGCPPDTFIRLATGSV